MDAKERELRDLLKRLNVERNSTAPHETTSQAMADKAPQARGRNRGWAEAWAIAILILLLLAATGAAAYNWHAKTIQHTGVGQMSHTTRRAASLRGHDLGGGLGPGPGEAGDYGSASGSSTPPTGSHSSDASQVPAARNSLQGQASIANGPRVPKLNVSRLVRNQDGS